MNYIDIYRELKEDPNCIYKKADDIKTFENFKCNGTEYKAVPEQNVEKFDGLYQSCHGCAFDNDIKNCEKAVSHLDCGVEGIIWLKIEEPVKVNLIEKEGYKLDENKVQYSLIPPYALEAVANNLTSGLSKYPRDNWKKVDNAEQRYLDAIYRHLEAVRKGEIYDPESSIPNMPHIAAVAANAMFLLEFLLDPKLKK